MNHICPEYNGKPNTVYYPPFTWRKGITGTVFKALVTLPKGILQQRRPDNKHSIGPCLKAVQKCENDFTFNSFP